MRRITYWTLSLSLLILILSLACSKKESGPPPTPAAEIPKDGVSSVPPAAERDPNMTAVDLPMAGAVKEVKAKVLDKEADDKDKALLRVKVLALDGPVDVTEDTKWELWKPGSDPEEQKAEANGWASSEAAVPAGTWDLRLLYDEGRLCKAEGWVRNVAFAAGKLWKAEIVLAAPMQYVRVFGTLNGKDVVDNMHIDLFKAGTDQQEFQPVSSFWSTQKQAIATGSYDLRLSYDRDNVKAKGALNGLAVGSNHGILKTTAALTKQ